ncbi:diaminobutyrate acetyltransferase [Glycomyces sp. TRM65418]|uniref:diaminobutyrate acetyltransferase n=1 Tax=Glycomyces sp. TRM65418 TaxID=2867006 RepID=UPI001CE5DE98|nr:diaminobutyrate acetyltransferase [Glycomyces sp. TRM65418]MCC3765490.1 diaminobutyrate acetyltransferase [Glycomyces sp. TRM65418]QZD55097.1 diaminobutyrate acetyltransferase [Glycomyces sp. TRM65418]
MPSGDASAAGPLGPSTQVRGSDDPSAGAFDLSHPAPQDGPLMWELAIEAGGLDVNSRYAYLLWCRDFAATTVVARSGERLAGFITGYRRPDAPDTLFVWQVAVGPDFRRRGLASRMLDHLVGSLRSEGVRVVESTVTPDNKASMHLFSSFAKANGADLTRDVLFSEHELGSDHGPEVLHRIGPLPERAEGDTGPFSGSFEPRPHRPAEQGDARGPEPD